MNKHYNWQGKAPCLQPCRPEGGTNVPTRFTMVLLCFLLLFPAALFKLYADGSRNLYPAGATGNRAFLFSTQGNAAPVSWPFKTIGAHYVYAKSGEWIAAASSAQGLGNGQIILTAPNGQVYTSVIGNNVGRILNRTAELAGPQYPTQGAGGNRYAPFTVQVDSNQEGIWKVEFKPTGDVTSSATPTPDNILANDEWSPQSSTSQLIAAWDISVRDASNSSWIEGRVYANVFNMHISSTSFTAARAFYGVYYVLTSDGIAYRVDNNGNNGAGFTFFVNNKGFLDASENSLYKSLNTSTLTSTSVHDPRVPDVNGNVTHKIFYTAPALDLPASAVQAVNSTTQIITWLKNTIITPTASNITYEGVEGTSGVSGSKGANIGFVSNLAGSYRIEIKSPTNAFPSRFLIGNTVAGTNTVFWDGKDGLGNNLPTGSTPIEINVQLFGAEVHFPFIDMEINPEGIIIEQLDATYNVIASGDRVYWDDSDVNPGNNNLAAGEYSSPEKNNTTGISSNTNGHKWGLYGSAGSGLTSFGNEKALDTWSFVPGNLLTRSITVQIAEADLEVVSITPSTTTVQVGSTVTYTVTVRNNGPSAVSGAGFDFIVPAGFTISSVTSNPTAGSVTESNATTTFGNGIDFSADLDMSNGGTIVYTITGTIDTEAGGISMPVEASIIRPNDVTDPDATNPALAPPTDPHIECKNGGTTENCNNIKYNTLNPTALADLSISKTVNVAVPAIGQQITFTVTVTNNGPNSATAVSVTDQLPSGFTFVSAMAGVGTFNPATGEWSVGSLANAASATLAITATVNATGSYTNTAAIAGTRPQIDPTPGNNSDDATSQPNPAADLSIIKTVNIATPSVGSNVVFTLTAANSGPSDATNVIITDQLPTGYTYVSHSGGTYVPATGLWTIGNLANGANSVLTITAGVNATGSYTNSASIDGTETDTDATDDTSSATTTPVNVIAATDDTNLTAINGYTGGTAISNILTNDTLNGTAVTASQVNITVNTPASNAGVSLNTTTGVVGVAAGTPAGSYTITYQICEKLNPTNCDTALATITVVAAPIDAVNNTVTNINGYTGGTGVTNVLTNDTLNGVAVIASEVTVTEGTGDTDELTINSNGTVDVAPGTPAGTYTLGYTICEVLNPTNCDNATVTVTVVPAPIDAVNDTVTNINGYTGGTGVTNVLTNDTLNGVAVIASEVTVTEGIGDTDELTINSNGTVDVAPGTPAGTYTLDYTICEVLNPTNCDSATVSVTVVPAPIDAVNDTVTNINGYTGGTGVINVLTNDTLNGVAVIASEVTVTEGTGDTDELTINTNGTVDVSPGTPAGTYTLGYTICEVLNQTNCDNATVTVTVVPAPIDAVNDTVTNINGYTGGTGVTNVLTNDTLNGVVVIASEVTVTEGTGDTDELTINTNGTVDVSPGTPAGTYTLGYTICEVLNQTNCDNATVTVTVVPAPIDAVNDTVTNINGYTGGNDVVNVLDNDTLNGVPVIPSQITITEVTGDPGLILDPATGTIDVLPNTPGGNHTIIYQLCEVLNPSNCDTATVTIFVMTPQLTVTKDAQSGTFDSVGDVITYDIVVTNTGNVTLTDIEITDANADAITPSTVGSLAPGASMDVVATHAITQADLDAGFVYNTASVTGTDPNGGTTTDNSSDSSDPSQPGDPGYDPACPDCTLTTITQQPSVAITKDAQSGTFDSVGDVITYDMVVTNTGNVTLTNIEVTDANADAITPSTVGSLAPGASVNVVATHAITQADLDAGFVHNTASVTGIDPNGGTTTDNSSDPTDPSQPGDPGYDPACPDCTLTTITQQPSVAITKDAQSGTFDSVGDVITYDIIITNTGNVTLTDIEVTDANADAITPSTVGSLAPGASVNVVATHAITQADLDAGFVYNTASVAGTDSNGNPVTDNSSDPTDPSQPGNPGYDPACPDCTITTMTQEPGLALFKDAVYLDTNADGIVNPGDTINYSFSVENTGNTTLTNISIDDPLVAVNGEPIPSIAPGVSDSTTFTANYILTQDDIEKGAVYNLAIVEATDSMGDPIISDSTDPTPIDVNDPLYDPVCSDCTVISLTQNPSMALMKEAVFNDENGDGRAQAGETISYNFKVMNMGNVTLHNLVITDPLPGVILNGTPIAVLEPGESDTTSYSAEYQITQADLLAGMVSNQAEVNGTMADGSAMSVKSGDGGELGQEVPTITDLSGCTIEIFNAVSPDGNGENDNLYIAGLECYPDNQVWIYNRWGVLVYDAVGYDNFEKSFKGFSEGRVTVSSDSRLPAGTYFYVIQYKKPDGSTHKKDGYLYLTR